MAIYDVDQIRTVASSCWLAGYTVETAIRFITLDVQPGIVVNAVADQYARLDYALKTRPVTFSLNDPQP